jgi:cardiolipin synthase A/B
MPMRHAVASAALLAGPLFGCGSSTHPADFTGDGGSPQPKSDSGSHPTDSGSSKPVSSQDSSTTSGTDSGGQDAALPPMNVPPPASSGIVVTVEPDGTGVAQVLLSAIQGATSAVHMEMYLLTNSTYINALIALHQSGIDVKVLLNQTFPAGTSSSDTNASSYPQLQSAGVDVEWAPTTTGFDSYTHEKAVIIDPGGSNAQVWVMTMNLDTDAPKYNREFLAEDTNAADIAEAESIFEADYATMSITPTGDLVVAPSPQNNAQEVLLALVNGATSSILVESEEYDGSGLEGAIASALESKAKAGVSVHMVLETSTESSQSSAVSALEAAGGQVVGYTYNGTSSLDIHAKAIVVDGTTAFVGSENLSGGSLGYNRELGVVFSVASEVSKVASAIEGDFSGGAAYP